jgi:hypothetical protein
MGLCLTARVSRAPTTKYYKAVKKGNDGRLFPLQDSSVEFKVGGTYKVKGFKRWHACRTPLAIVERGYGYELSDPVLEVELGSEAVTDDGLTWCSLVMRVIRIVPEEEVARLRAEPQCLVVQKTKTWYANGVAHRGGDLPAIERANGDKEWWVDGKRHRACDLPAVVGEADGIEEWWVDGKRHRDGDLPAVVGEADGIEEWWVDGKRHRDGDLPALECMDGHREWWANGFLHRDNNLPAVVKADGAREWWDHGRCLRNEKRITI